MSNTMFIYALCDPDTGAVHYIGQSKNPEQRIKSHCWLDRNGGTSFRAQWLHSLLKSGKYPVLRILERVTHGERPVDRERWWIVELQRQGQPITNMCLAGERGERIVLPETTEKIRAICARKKRERDDS